MHAQRSFQKFDLAHLPFTEVSTPSELPARSAEHFHDFGNLLALVVFVAACDGVLNAMADMIAEDFFFGAAKCCSSRQYLRHNIYAVAVLRNHSGQAPDLALDAAEPFKNGGFCFNLHS